MDSRKVPGAFETGDVRANDDEVGLISSVTQGVVPLGPVVPRRSKDVQVQRVLDHLRPMFGLRGNGDKVAGFHRKFLAFDDHDEVSPKEVGGLFVRVVV